MEILSPIYLWFLLSIPVLALFYILGPWARVQSVSSLRLWTENREPGDKRLRWRRLYRNPHLMLQALALLLLIAALIHPVLKLPATPSGRLVLIFDTSAGMNSLEGEESRMDLAKKEAAGILSRRKEGNVVMIKAGPEPEIFYEGNLRDPREAIRAIRDLHAGDGPGRLPEAVQKLIPPLNRRDELVLLTDGADPETLRIHRDYPAASIVSVGKTDRNVALSSLVFSDRPRGIVAEVKNHGGGTDTFSLEVLRDGRRIAFETKGILPHETVPVFVTLPPRFDGADPVSGEREGGTTEGGTREGGTIEARLHVKDALSADNRSWIVTPGIDEQTTLLLVTSGNRLLERTLKANAQWDVTVMDPPAYESDSDASRRFDVVLLDHYPLTPGTSRSVSGQAGLFFIAPPGEVATRGSGREGPGITDWDNSHPVMEFVEPGHLRIRRGVVLQPPPWADLLLEGADPLIYAETDFSRRTLVMGFDPWDSDFPKSPSFPIFVMNGIRWLAGKDRGGQIQAGAVYRLKVPSALQGEGLWVLTPDGRKEWVTPKNDLLRYGNTEIAGVYRLQGETPKGKFERRFAVVTEPGGSSIRPLSIPQGPGEGGGVSHRPDDVVRIALWKPLAILALGVMTVEWFLRNRFSFEVFLRRWRETRDGFIQRHRA